MFETVFPMLASSDLDAALRFYRDLLGCRETYRFPPTGAPQYVGLELGGAELGLGGGAATRDPDASEVFSLCVYTSSCDDSVAYLRAGGVRVVEEPADQPWGERMAVVADPDGNRVVLIQRLD
jgi:lactoylglutathione lyase